MTGSTISMTLPRRSSKNAPTRCSRVVPPPPEGYGCPAGRGPSSAASADPDCIRSTLKTRCPDWANEHRRGSDLEAPSDVAHSGDRSESVYLNSTTPGRYLNQFLKARSRNSSTRHVITSGGTRPLPGRGLRRAGLVHQVERPGTDRGSVWLLQEPRPRQLGATTTTTSSGSCARPWSRPLLSSRTTSTCRAPGGQSSP